MQMCEVCIMDWSCKPIEFFGESGCSYCLSASHRLSVSSEQKNPLTSLVQKIQKSVRTQNQEYDCIVGVSGGLDSTYLLARIVELGLRPLAVHMDNNWNSSMASRNLRRALEALEVDLITYVTPWRVQRDWQRALLNADVVDVELLYDNMLHEVCYREARRRRIKVIIGGANNATEGVEVPKSWIWHKFDGRNLRAIARHFSVKVTDMPTFSYWKWMRYTFINRIQWLSLLDWMPEYSRETAQSFLVEKYGYQPYGSKHFENVFTRFFQAEILPKKFGIDKRRPHLSSEIISGKISRLEALRKLEEPLYPTPALRELDRRYVLDKLRLSQGEFETYLRRPGVPHASFKQDNVGKIVRLALGIRDRMLTKRGPVQ